MVNDRTIYILGGGVSGLSLAYELQKKGQQVEIIEKSSNIGGLAKTLKWKDHFVDMGPHIYHTPDKDIENYWKKEFTNLFHEREHWSKNMKNGELFDYPISKEFIESLPSDTQDKINSELKNINPEDLANAKNYHEYIRALAGKTLQEMFFIKYPEKLWGMSTKELDANWAPKRIQFREKSTPFYYGQWSAVGNEGSGTIIESLGQKVVDLGGIVNLEESVNSIELSNSRISKIKTSKRTINVFSKDIVVNTTSYTQICSMLGYSTALKYRGVALVILEINTDKVFPQGVDFIYIDNEEMYFNRISDQNSFIKNKEINQTLVCCEITYNKNDKIDVMNESKLISNVKSQFSDLGFCQVENITDAIVVKLPEVYPMFFLGYQNALSKTKSDIDRVENLYTLGSLAEFAYSDLQILFGKAIDLAHVITDKTFNINQINKTNSKLNFNKKVSIKNRPIGVNHMTYVIAEIGLNHNGNMNVAKKLIDEAIISGADAVKLQSYKSKNRVAEHGKTSRYVEKVLGVEETDYEMLKKNELSFKQTKELFEYAKDRITIFSAPFDLESVDELEILNVDCYKIASFDLVNLPLLRKVAETGKPIILSTGMSYLSEVEEALRIFANSNNFNIMLLQCTSSYPCPPESMNIRAIDTMKSAFNNLPVGLSDHVIGDTVSLAAVARGANIIEKHFTLDKQMEGPDHILSLEPKEFREMVDRIRLIEVSLGDGVKQPASSEITSVIRFRKTMYSARDIKKGESISFDCIAYKGPAYGIYAKYESVVFNMSANKDIPYDTPITWDILSGIENNSTID